MGDLRNDIEKYLRGELSPADRHALEKRALSDPFLADALEGADSISMDDFSADLKSLQHSLAQRTQRDEEKKVIPLWSWTMRIAAGLLIVAVAGFAVYQITNNKYATYKSLRLISLLKKYLRRSQTKVHHTILRV